MVHITQRIKMIFKITKKEAEKIVNLANDTTIQEGNDFYVTTIEVEEKFREAEKIVVINNKINEILKDAEDRIKLCLKDTNKKKEEGMPPHLKEHWDAEALGYKTSIECIKRTREKFKLF